MVAVASVVVAAGAVTGVVSALDGRAAVGEATTAGTTGPPRPDRLPAEPSPPPATTPSGSGSGSPSASPGPTSARREPGTPPAGRGGHDRRGAPAPTAASGPAATAASGQRLYRHPESRVLDWVRANPDDPRRPVIEARIADQPAAVWFADFTPATITARVAAVTSGAAARSRVPVLVPYAIPDRDCGGHSRGGAPGLDAYDAWIDRFAAGLGTGEVIVVLEPDAVAQAGCLPAAERADRFASLARAGRVLKAANPRARVYHDAGHSGWHPAERQARLLRQAGAASPASSDGVFSNVSNFHRTADEIPYVRRVLDALGGPPGLGAVIDTSRNGNGAPADGQWCDPSGRGLGRTPTLTTGEERIDAYLWVKLPGESDGCKGAPGTFTPSYAYDLARRADSSASVP
ncbi:glycoside hydrolase family 6 protein [Streptomyces sp. JB150]|uniref:glycoside hydrolase family 6 protein n=1 Tax=Streptomyces sp. JB150 TaxID=2714844 RepID=UPI0014095548|nr:glycoside hydrolase family 6 protein [Streptomyces sp. JB150]QIJ66429.1 glycoside hydrolase family 6 protein [Streptomyces sp. JB150]